MEISYFSEGSSLVFLEEFVKLEFDCFGTDAWNKDSVSSHLQSKPSILLVSENEPLGYAFIFESSEEIEIFRIGIVKSHRGKGLGSKILQYLVTDFRKPIFLEVRRDNIDAIRLYKGNGFHLIGHRKKYYSDNMDALLFRYG